MNWRAPWLRDAKDPVKLACLDTVSIIISYNLISWFKLGDWPGVNKGVATVVIAWIIVSYGIGRYSWDKEERGSASDTRRALLEMVPGGAVIALFVGHAWLYQIFDAQTRFRGFLLPLVALATVLSFGLRSVIGANGRSRSTWIAIASGIEIDTIRHELKRESKLIRKSISLYPAERWKEAYEALKTEDGLTLGMTNSADKELEAALLEARGRGKSISPIISWCENNLSRIPPELVSTEWLVRAEGFSIRPGNVTWRIKRLCDVLVSVCLLVITAPIAAVAGLFIWLEDGKPIFYGQVRTGLNGKLIKVWKLRSMYINSERGGAQWASAADPRVTRVGKIIRATRIDELPQLIGVIKGDLSLIGPRPERPEIELGLEREISHYRIRQWVRPGLSGWAQVCFPYGASVEDSRMKLSYDIYYLRNGGLLLDLVIALKTIRMIAWARGSKPKY